MVQIFFVNFRAKTIFNNTVSQSYKLLYKSNNTIKTDELQDVYKELFAIFIINS